MVDINELPFYLIMALIIYAETKEGDSPAIDAKTLREVESIMKGLKDERHK
jgi:hypothetical protein